MISCALAWGIEAVAHVCGAGGFGFWRHGLWDEYEKGIWWMPWHQEAMKDVARCENLGGAASGL